LDALTSSVLNLQGWDVRVRTLRFSYAYFSFHSCWHFFVPDTLLVFCDKPAGMGPCQDFVFRPKPHICQNRSLCWTHSVFFVLGCLVLNVAAVYQAHISS
jgi:hypothetical protein